MSAQDFNPGPRNPWVQWGDATRLQFANGTFDYVYTNVVDHIAPLERFYADATRARDGADALQRRCARRRTRSAQVLKPGGRLVLHAAWNKPDKWSMQTFRGGTDELVAKLLAETPLKMVFRQKYPGNGRKDPTRALMTSFAGGDEIIVEKPFPSRSAKPSKGKSRSS